MDGMPSFLRRVPRMTADRVVATRARPSTGACPIRGRPWATSTTSPFMSRPIESPSAAAPDCLRPPVRTANNSPCPCCVRSTARPAHGVVRNNFYWVRAKFVICPGGLVQYRRIEPALLRCGLHATFDYRLELSRPAACQPCHGVTLCLAKKGTISVGPDWFLDVVANIVGILIILIVVAGIKAGAAPVTAARVADYLRKHPVKAPAAAPAQAPVKVAPAPEQSPQKPAAPPAPVKVVIPQSPQLVHKPKRSKPSSQPCNRTPRRRRSRLPPRPARKKRSRRIAKLKRAIAEESSTVTQEQIKLASAREPAGARKERVDAIGSRRAKGRSASAGRQDARAQVDSAQPRDSWKGATFSSSTTACPIFPSRS